MSRFYPSVCIDAVFEGLPVGDAIRQVKQAGIPALEFWGWWDRDLAEIELARDDCGLQIAACCTRFISLVDSNCRNDYLAGLEASIATAQRLDCKTLISQVGDALPGVSRREQHQSLVDGLKEAPRQDSHLVGW